MSNNPKLLLEVLNGPLDGHLITLDEDTDWTRTGSGPLSFIWDHELGEPQARFHSNNQGWKLEAKPSPHGLYIYYRGNAKRLAHGVIDLQAEMIIRAAHSWLLVRDPNRRNLE